MQQFLFVIVWLWCFALTQQCKPTQWGSGRWSTPVLMQRRIDLSMECDGFEHFHNVVRHVMFPFRYRKLIFMFYFQCVYFLKPVNHLWEGNPTDGKPTQKSLDSKCPTWNLWANPNPSTFFKLFLSGSILAVFIDCLADQILLPMHACPGIATSLPSRLLSVSALLRRLPLVSSRSIELHLSYRYQTNQD